MKEPVAILVVDDEENYCEFMAIMLEEAGFRKIQQAASAEQCLKALARQKFDLVISDYNMPGMNGLEFLKKVHELYPEVKRILMSGKERLGLPEDLTFLLKPFFMEELADTVKAALNSP